MLGMAEDRLERADAATRAWRFLTHDDGDIALFNDSWIGEVPPPGTILDSQAIALPHALPDAGYFRPDEFDQLCSDARAADVGDLPGRMIGNFVELFRS